MMTNTEMKNYKTSGMNDYVAQQFADIAELIDSNATGKIQNLIEEHCEIFWESYSSAVYHNDIIRMTENLKKLTLISISMQEIQDKINSSHKKISETFLIFQKYSSFDIGILHGIYDMSTKHDLTDK